MDNKEKLNWLVNIFPGLLERLQPTDSGKWGKLNAIQMVEHLCASLRQASGKEVKVLLTPAEHLERLRAFMLSEKPFKENTKNSEMPEDPIPAINLSMQEAISELKMELKDFIAYYQLNPQQKLMNPFFGELDFDEWIHLLHKHAMHHARQFALID